MAYRFVQWYTSSMRQRPLLTNVCTAVPLMVCGDTVAQRLEGNKEQDVGRTLTMACYSGLVFTPLFHRMYRWMDRSPIFKHAWFDQPLRAAATKSLFSVVVAGTPANAVFLTMATTIEMKVFEKKARDGADLPTVVWGKLHTELPRIMMGSLSFW